MSYGQVTLAQLQAQLAERYDSAAFWTSEQARLAINEAIRVYNMLTGVFRESVPVSALPGDHFISLPGSMTYRTRFLLNGVPLRPASLHDMYTGQRHWRSETTSSGGSVPTSIKVWIPAGITLVFIWPAPTVVTPLTVEGISTAPILVNAGDFIDLGQEEIGPILGYALHYLAFSEGGVRFKATMKYYTDFIIACGNKNARLRASNLYRYATGLDVSRGTNVLQADPVAKLKPPLQS